jgi:hypothetical protein
VITELRCQLSLEALMALTRGEELAFDGESGKDKYTIVIRCSDAALASMRSEIERAMLHLLPIDSTSH